MKPKKPNKDRKVLVTVSIDPKILRRLDSVDEYGLSRSAKVRIAIHEYVERRK